MNIEFIEKDQIWSEEKTNYWFRVNGEPYAISDCSRELTLLDFEGFPVEECNGKGIKDALIPEYEKRIND
jgi:hypothetical protein